MNQPVFLRALEMAEHLYGDPLVVRQSHANVAPEVADFPLENLCGDAQFLFSAPNRGTRARLGRFF
jgi:hypothetical protein